MVKVLERNCDHDFSGYKPGTLVRRIERRLSLARLRSVATYMDRRSEDDAEAQRLFQDFMIGVTRFFRDEESAISRTHDLLTGSDWRGTTLAEIVEAAAYTDAPDERIEMTGDTLNFTPRETVSVGMGIHELLKNAAKYGALSAENRKINIAT